MSKYLKATNELVDLVGKVIRECRQDLSFTPYECVFRDKANDESVSGMGKLSVKSGIDAFLYFQAHDGELVEGDFFLVIEVAQDVWQIFNEDQKKALIDHLLAYVEIEEGTNKLIKHRPDSSEFYSVAARRGAWHTSIKDMVTAVTKRKMPLITRVEELEARQAEEAEAEGVTVTLRKGARRQKNAEASV